MSELVLMVEACDPCTLEVEDGRELEVSLGY